MERVSSKKTEKKALNKIEELLDKLDYVDYKFNADDTGISWDGYIDLYSGNVDQKENFDTRIDVQIKGKSTTIKRLQSKWKFDIGKKDLENYNKIDGTLFLAVRFLKNGEFKIYYNSLLPKNITDLLKEQPNSKNEIRVTLKEITDEFHLERICRNFALDKDTQKRLSKEIFDKDAISIGDKKLGTFSAWSRGKFNPLTILGEEKFIYVRDENQNIIDVEYAEINEVVHGIDINVKNKSGQVFYKTIKHSVELDGTEKFKFGKAFSLSPKQKKFSITLSGTLTERIKQLEFLDDLIDNNGFIIGEGLVTIKPKKEEKDRYSKLYEAYLRIYDFCKRHNIKKDPNIDEWDNKDINRFLIWINAIDNNTKIKIKEWDISTVGSIQIKDIRFSVFADKLKDDSFEVYSLWNDSRKNHFQFRYNEGKNAIFTKNFFSILNKDAYMADDIDIEEMKMSYNENDLEKGEEVLLNLQALEALKAYDDIHETQLLDYAKFLLNKIIKFGNMHDIARINYLQIEKRLRKLEQSEIEELIRIRDKNKEDFFKISCNILIDNLVEAKLQYKSLKDEERKTFSEFPIYKLLNYSKEGD